MGSFNDLVNTIVAQVTAQLPAWGKALQAWIVGRAQGEIAGAIDLIKGGDTVNGLRPIADSLDADAFDVWVQMLTAKEAADVDAAAEHKAAEVQAIEIVGGFVVKLLALL